MLVVDPRKSYVPVLLVSSILLTTDSIAGSGKSVLTCVA